MIFVSSRFPSLDTWFHRQSVFIVARPGAVKERCSRRHRILLRTTISSVKWIFHNLNEPSVVERAYGECKSRGGLNGKEAMTAGAIDIAQELE